MSTIAPARPRQRMPVSSAWSEAGFARPDADAWRRAGWRDPGSAAHWMAASPTDDPGHLRRLHDAGYSVHQVATTANLVHGHVAAWTAALVRPEDDADDGDRSVLDLR